MNIFLDEQDMQVFLSRLKENLFPELVKHSASSKYAVRRKTLPSGSYDLISYCLMPNHFHLLIKQNGDISITQIILKVCTGYAKYFNKKYNRVGSIFQDRFKAVRIHKNNQLLWVSYYIHKNPSEAGLIKNLHDYKWSSFLEYVKRVNDPICNKDLISGQFQKSNNYLNYFNEQAFEDYKKNLISKHDLLIDWE